MTHDPAEGPDVPTIKVRLSQLIDATAARLIEVQHDARRLHEEQHTAGCLDGLTAALAVVLDTSPDVALAHALDRRHTGNPHQLTLIHGGRQ